ncbi:MAG: T6SS effector amidase Tae4 family protein [Planctomycetota bacterium]|jgi:hypothetical protein
MSIQGTSIANLQNHYPGSEKLGTDLIEETLGESHWLLDTDDPNTCAIRLSLAFNNAGLPISRVSGITMSKGQDDNWYIYKVDHFVKYCEKQYGKADVVAKSYKETELKDEIIGKPGVLFFRLRKANRSGRLVDLSLFGHADIWDGASVWYNPIIHKAWQLYLWRVGST